MATNEELKHVHHASNCGDCGALLREAVSDLNLTTTPSEAAEIAALESSQPEWQERLAHRIAQTARQASDSTEIPPRKRWLSVPALAVVGAVVVSAILGYTWYFSRQQSVDAANRLLAQAYTEQRTLEPRIAGARYAEIRVEKGSGIESSFIRRPEALLNAEALIARHLSSNPSDPAWLQAKARADLLEGKYEGAVESLRHALQLAPNSVAARTDLATAYFQQKNYGAAYETLSQVLLLVPEDPVALFNRGVVSERQYLYRQALEDWEHYLRVDPRSEWADDARRHADTVREKLKKHDESQSAPLPSPAEMMSAQSTANVDLRIDEFMDEAIQSWLPRAYPAAGARVDTSVVPALFFLTELTQRQHQDRWLKDLLQGASSPGFPGAVMALSRAVKANSTGDYNRSATESLTAYRLFRSQGNVAGALRAQFEQLLSMQLRRHSDSCRRMAASAWPESEKYPYPWLQIQLGLEGGLCSGLMGDIGSDKKAAHRAMERARQSGYGALYLRAVAFAAEDENLTGDQSSAANLAGLGLERYWSGQFPALRGFALYTVLTFSAEAAGWPSLQMSSLREGVSLIDSEENLFERAMAHNVLANAAIAAQRPLVAEQHYAEAARLYALAPKTETTRINRIENEIRIAQIEARQGELDAAMGRLTRVQGEVRSLSNNYLAQIFYSILGEIQLRSHHEAEAEQALRPALQLTEQRLGSLNSAAERIKWSEDAAPIYLGMAEAELLQGRTQESLEWFEWYLGAPQRVATTSTQNSLRGNSQPAELKDPSRIPARLPMLVRETVLAYGLLPDGLAIWTYDNRGVNAQWIPKSTRDSQALRDLATGFLELCSDPKSELSALRRDGSQLYSYLIAPVEQRLDTARTLVIEAEGWLGSLPFEALPDAGGRYLVERGAIVHSLGLYSDEALRADVGIHASSPTLIVASGASWEGRGLKPIPDVAGEADTVAHRFPEAHVLNGATVTLNSVMKALPATEVFHFTGHSVATSSDAGLLLEGPTPETGLPRMLDGNQTRHMHLPKLQLAVLSACSTGADSTGFSNVTEALLRIGVPHVVASRWSVDSVETRRFVEGFYDNLLSGVPVSEATRIASRKMLSNSRTAHPYYWSTFVAFGRQ